MPIGRTQSAHCADLAFRRLCLLRGLQSALVFSQTAVYVSQWKIEIAAIMMYIGQFFIQAIGLRNILGLI